MKLLSLLAATFLVAASALAEDPATFPVGAFTFTRPTDWSWVEVSSPMRKAQLKVPGSDAAAGAASGADVVFFYFGENGGGDVESNIKRWVGQFQGGADTEKVDHQEAGATKITFVSTQGTFQSGMPGGQATPLSDYALLGAILENAGGNVFVKMTGPAGVVKAKHDQFVEFITGAAKALK